jgi:hypothetical protein
MVKVEEFSKDETLRELIGLVGTNRIHTQVAQAAAWHLTDKMSWRQLANKVTRHAGGTPATRYFNLPQLLAAQRLVALAHSKAREDKKPAQEQKPKQRSVRGRLTRGR